MAPKRKNYRRHGAKGLCRLVGLRLSRSVGKTAMIHVPASDTPTIIWVGVDRVQGESAKLAFEAPSTVIIVREELINNGHDKIPSLPADTRTDCRGDSSDSG